MKAFNLSRGMRGYLMCSILALFLFNPFSMQANHDVCDEAIAVSCGDVIMGNNEGATDDDDVDQCGIQSLGHGLWYSVEGTGGDITVSTCDAGTNFDTQLSIYTGTCDDLDCFANNNNNSGCENFRQAEVTFASMAGETYYILIGGALGARGDFVMTIECEQVAPPNDDCMNAAPIACNQTILGTTINATSQSTPFCGTSLSSGPGVWYTFQGTGDLVEVTTCGAGTDYDTKLGVFSGSCASLSCVGGDDDDACPFSSLFSRVNFTSVSGTTYYIYVTGFGSGNGDFELSLTCSSASTNDNCVDAIPMTCNSSVTGNTDDATPDNVAFCGTSLTSANGEWYSFVGNGQETTVTTCNPGTDYDTKLGIFTGTCANLTCIGGNDDQAGGADPACFSTGGTFNRASTVTFTSVAGQTYYILITGFGTNTGNYELSVSCAIQPPGDPDPLGCDDAESISCGESVIGNTEDGQINDLDDCAGEAVDTAPGVFYVFEGNNSIVTATTCSSVTNYDSKLAVFSGSCDDLTCVTANNNNPGDCSSGPLSARHATVEFLAETGTTYYIYVTGQMASKGDFELSITECALPNDDCINAEPIACGDTVSGDTDEAQPDSGLPFCGTTVNNRRGVWYVLDGTDTQLTASTCNAGTNFDTKLAVFTGTCDNLICVGGDDDDPSCGFSSLRSTVTFTAVSNETYYIFVAGFGTTTTGDFVLSVTGNCDNGGGGGPDNDNIIDNVCDADDLTLDQSYGFSNVGATAQPGEVSPGAGTDTGGGTCNAVDGWCSFETDVDNSVWFKFVAPASGCINASAVTSDFQIAIWTVGNCNDFGTFTEIAANDDSGPGLSPALTNLSVTPGLTYYVQVDGYNGATSPSGLVLVQDCGFVPLQSAANNLLSPTTSEGWNLSNVYPNPSAGAPVTFELTAPREVPGEVYLLDNLGRVVTTQQEVFMQGFNRTQVQLDGLAPGMYHLHIRAGEQTFQRKVMVVRP